MSILKWILLKLTFHQCFDLKISSKGMTGIILKCDLCERRYKIRWDDFTEIYKDAPWLLEKLVEEVIKLKEK